MVQPTGPSCSLSLAFEVPWCLHGSPQFPRVADTEVGAPSRSRSEAEAASEGRVPDQPVGAGFYLCGQDESFCGRVVFS